MADKAERLRELHQGPSILVLPNAWDVMSARLVEDAGAAAVATSSAGVAWSLGAPDGDRLDRDRALDLIARVAAAVRVPVTADIENGYATDPGGVADTIRGVIAAGAVGVNLEDTTYGTGGPATVSALVKGIDAPLNILAGPGAPSIAELAALGVARVSVGSKVAAAAYGAARRAAEELFGAGTYGGLSGALDYGALNALLATGAKLAHTAPASDLPVPRTSG